MIRRLPESAGDRCWARIGVDGDRSCPELATLVHCRNCPAQSESGRALLDRPSPPGYLEEWAARVAESGEDAPEGTRAILLFRLRSEWFGLPADLATEVLEARPIRRVPHRSSPAFRGLVAAGGRLLPCCDPAAVFDVPEADATSNPAGRLLVVALRGEPWVLLADEIAGLRVVEESAIRPAPSTVALAGGSATSGLVEWKGHRVSLLDERRLAERLLESVG
ncbi:MAG: chemotaxis protein CheW [Alphaproteobacteria bacterium]